MKTRIKSLSLLLMTLILSGTKLQAQQGWSIGLQPGPSTSISQFKSGDENAHALFGNDIYKGCQISVLTKYHFSERKAIETGIILSKTGFNFNLSKNYSLKNPFKRYEQLQTDIGLITLPVMAVIHTKRNCSNVRWFFGIGAAAQFIQNTKDVSKYITIGNETDVNGKSGALSSTTNSIQTVSASVIWKIGMEKQLKRGGAITISYTGNQGLTDVAESEVVYSIDQQLYRHTFTNKASFVNLAIGYQFAPFGSRKAQKN